MAAPTYSIVVRELHLARGHLYALVETLSQEELLWVPPRSDGVCVSYHFGHIALVEDLETATLTDKLPKATPEFHEAFDVHNANNPHARFPSGAAIIDYVQAVRAETLLVLALRFRAIRSDAHAIEVAEPFRRLINHEYSHTKYIRRIRLEMGKGDVDPPQSELIVADERAIAAPQYGVAHW